MIIRSNIWYQTPKHVPIDPSGEIRLSVHGFSYDLRLDVVRSWSGSCFG
jgi:hypothetical protein